VNISKLLKETENPKPYVKGTEMMWVDHHISKHLLKAHLNPDIGIASRTFDAINDTVEMIDKMIKPGSKILDLGCGPGLYAERLAKKGHYVTGVDFSKYSIDYAMKQRDKNLSNIDYINENYLNLDFENRFDLVMMIYCDFGALIPEERNSMIKIIRKSLKPKGIFLFDSIGEGAVEKLNFGTSWEMAESGFYSPEPYICLNKSFHFPDIKAVLKQHIVIIENSSVKLYRFWNHYFDVDDVRQLFLPKGFSRVNAINFLLKGDGPYNDNGVVFFAISK